MNKIDHEYFVSLEVAKLLKETGFDWECRKCYNNGVLFDMESDEIRTQVPQHSSYDILAPTLDVAQRWLREVKKLYIEIRRMPKCDLFDRYFTSIAIMQEPFDTELRDKDDEIIYISGKTYEEALEAAIKKALEIILEKSELKKSNLGFNDSTY